MQWCPSNTQEDSTHKHSKRRSAYAEICALNSSNTFSIEKFVYVFLEVNELTNVWLKPHQCNSVIGNKYCNSVLNFVH